jgi:hypothetical protein
MGAASHPQILSLGAVPFKGGQVMSEGSVAAWSKASGASSRARRRVVVRLMA